MCPRRCERLRRPRVEQNIAVSARLTASRTDGPTPSAAPAPPRDSERAAPRVDDGLLRLLDWDTPLPELGPEA